ncbi:hypothetical protein FGG08_002554 [Glutinoglossum americanum]|uniref:non-specific serine/threonine protein kinase n=1 Tax=Glutinoglossum americanum TaxID=1670608 RepID=A0A9P8ICQ5_9PEZI|nr:hypothetical protein FGG08_002554 [Glutinoglossum americanum]
MEEVESVLDNWSGRGLPHVDFDDNDSVPLDVGHAIGEGLSGQVYEVVCKGVRLARKFTRRKEAIQNEINILRKLRGTHIIRYIGSYTYRGWIGILLWPVAICDLNTLLLRFESPLEHQSKDPWRRLGFSIMEASQSEKLAHPALFLKRNFGCLANAITYLHGNGIRHKDLKPQNILVTERGIVVTDFGVSTDFSERDRSESDGLERGSVRYFAPELENWNLRGRPADIYSLGCIFLEMATVLHAESLTDLKAFQRTSTGNSHFHLCPIQTELWVEKLAEKTIPEHLEVKMFPLIRRMLGTNPADRPEASNVSMEIAKLGGDLSVLHAPCCNGLPISVELSQVFNSAMQRSEQLHEAEITGLYYRISQLEEALQSSREERKMETALHKSEFLFLQGQLSDSKLRQELAENSSKTLAEQVRKLESALQLTQEKLRTEGNVRIAEIAELRAKLEVSECNQAGMQPTLAAIAPSRTRMNYGNRTETKGPPQRQPKSIDKLVPDTGTTDSSASVSSIEMDIKGLLVQQNHDAGPSSAYERFLKLSSASLQGSEGNHELAREFLNPVETQILSKSIAKIDSFANQGGNYDPKPRTNRWETPMRNQSRMIQPLCDQALEKYIQLYKRCHTATRPSSCGSKGFKATKGTTSKSPSTNSEEAPVYHPLLQDYFAKTGDVNIVRERIHELEFHQRELFKEQQLRKDYGIGMSEENANFLATFEPTHEGLESELRELELGAHKLKLRCISEGLLSNDLPVEYSLVASPELSVKTPLVKPEGEETQRTEGSGTMIISNEGIIQCERAPEAGGPIGDLKSTRDRVNGWLLDILRSSPMNIRQYMSYHALVATDYPQRNLDTAVDLEDVFYDATLSIQESASLSGPTSIPSCSSCWF